MDPLPPPPPQFQPATTLEVHDAQVTALLSISQVQTPPILPVPTLDQSLPPTLPVPTSRGRPIESTEPITHSPTPTTESHAFSVNKEHRQKLGASEKLVLMKIYQNFSWVYLNDKLQTQFWKLVTSKFKKATNNLHKTLKNVVKVSVEGR